MTFIGVDIGTFEAKAVLVDADGEVLAMARHRHTLATPQPGHVEHDPRTDWWDGLVAVIGELLQHPGGAAVEAVGVSAIGPCVVAVDEELEPLRNAILYGVDTRATAQVDDLVGALGADEIFRRSGNALTSQSAGPKIKWLRDEEPDVWNAARWFLTSQSWLVAKLTGEVTIDHGTAGYFHPLYDLEAQRWNLDGCDDFIDERRLPRIEWSTTVAGEVHARAAAETGLPAGTKVIVGTTDAPAEAVAAGVLSDGVMMAMYGSSGFFIRAGAAPITNEALWAAPYVFPNMYVLAAGTAAAGTSTRWIADLLDVTADTDDETFGDLIALAETAPVGADGVLCLPHFAGERTPFQDPYSRGAFVGLGLDHHRGHVARALLEGVGHGIAEAILTYVRNDVSVDSIIAIGGATRNDIITGTVSTVTGLHQTIADSAGASFGDAILAALGVGALADREAARRWCRFGRTIEPDPAATEMLTAEHERFLRLYDSLAAVPRPHTVQEGDPDA